jgi:hypothetical protein
VRGTSLERWPAARQPDTVDVDGLPVRVKVSPGRTKVEHDDAARVAELRRRPLRDVVADAEARARARRSPAGHDRGDEGGAPSGPRPLGRPGHPHAVPSPDADTARDGDGDAGGGGKGGGDKGDGDGGDASPA